MNLDECPICLESLEASGGQMDTAAIIKAFREKTLDKQDLSKILSAKIAGKSITLECGHVFHERCILKWVKDHTTCPLDRKVMDGEAGEILIQHVNFETQTFKDLPLTTTVQKLKDLFLRQYNSLATLFHGTTQERCSNDATLLTLGCLPGTKTSFIMTNWLY